METHRKRLVFVSPNTFRDLDFRETILKEWQKHGYISSTMEATITLSEALSGYDGKARLLRDEKSFLILPPVGRPVFWTELISLCGDKRLPRDSSEVIVKLFPSKLQLRCVKQALQAVFRLIESNYVDSLQVSVPPPYSSAQFKSFWTKLSKWIKSEKTVKELGVCGVGIDALELLLAERKMIHKFVLYEEDATKITPDSQISKIAKANGIFLATHFDKNPILDQSIMKIHFGDEKIVKWVVRYVVRQRSSLLDKRWLVGLKKNQSIYQQCCCCSLPVGLTKPS